MSFSHDAAKPPADAQSVWRNDAGELFDQYGRYAACAEHVAALLPEGGTVLDVGCGPFRLLGGFLPGCRVTYLDPLLEPWSGEPGVLACQLDDAGLEESGFDVVVSVDTLEHVPAAERAGFLRRLRGLARLGVVVGAPFGDDGHAAAVDDHIQQLYRAKTGRDYPWLEEHQAWPLPGIAESRAELATGGWQSRVAGQGHAPWLSELLGLHVLLLDRPEHLPLLRDIGRRFARELYQYDRLYPVYRHFLVAAESALLARQPDTIAPQAGAAARQAWTEFRGWVQVELARFFDARAVEHAQAIADRAALRREQESLRGELGGVRAELAAADAARREAVAACAEVAEQRDALVEQRDGLLAAQESIGQRLQQLEREAADGHHAYAMLLAERRSLSWRVTAPLRAFDGAVRALFRATRRVGLRLLAGAARLLPRSLEWRLKSVFFRLARPLLGGTRELQEFEAVAEWRGRPLATGQSDGVVLSELEAARLEPGDDAVGDVVVFGVIDWDFRVQRPQHLATELAKGGRRVFYLAAGFVPAERAGFQLRRVRDDLPIWEVRLAAPSGIRVYDGALHGAALGQVAGGLRELLGSVRMRHAIGIVDHPGWWPVARLLPRTQLVYDCMDNHHGFAEAGPQLAADEAATLAGVETLVVSSVWLRESFQAARPDLRMVRNGCDPRHFQPGAAPAADAPRVIGYFGAMAEWFDRELMREVAEAFGDCEILLVGADTAGVVGALGGCSNVRAIGEVPYAELPDFVARMDVCLIPFLINDLTRATNPVKAYESLAAGKPVVATPMPELVDEDFGGYVRIAPRGPEFVAAVATALETARDPELIAARRAVALGHTWPRRAGALLDAVVASRQPRASVVVVTWNGVELSRRCVASVLDDPAAPEVEVLVVDNASGDDTPRWLDEIEQDHRVRVIRNADNLGFAAACNQGLAAASGELLVILNNDIVVTPGWLRTLHRHFREHPDLGLLGPVTNNIGNEARIVTGYGRDLDAMQDEQRAYTGGHAGRLFELPVLAFFCVAMPRAIYEAVGDLDEKFGQGFFEDDDYAQRVRQIGRRVMCAEDVFVHHELSASFDKIDQGRRRELFERNRAYYESKWGAWEPHTYREVRS